MSPRGAVPTVSVIVPCYNHGRYLAEALNSILDQSSAADEVIVVDDGSTDDSHAVAAGFGGRVRLVRQARQGIGGARNAGLPLANGEIIGFLDADDLWPADSLSRRRGALAADGAVGCVFGETEQFISPELDDATKASLHCPAGASLARFAGAMLVRRAAFDAVGPFDASLKVGEMMEWIGRLDDRAIRVANVAALALRRRIHGANTVLTQTNADYLRALQATLRRRAAAERGAQ
jgi:glycosyltransferase involved in cell wall biosynthesis